MIKDNANLQTLETKKLVKEIYNTLPHIPQVYNMLPKKCREENL